MIQTFGTGRVGTKPEMRYTPQGTAVTNFSVACDVGFGEYQQTIWVRISTFGKLAEACNQYLSKGRWVSFIGVPNPDKDTGNPRVYEQNGEHRSSYDVKASEVKFIGGSQRSEPERDVEF